MVSESDGGDVEFCDEDFLEQMDHDDGPGGDGDSDFKTVNESDFGESEQMMYDEG
jgi:hypothetical protein